MKCDNQYCKYRNEARPNGCYWETTKERCRYYAEELPIEVEQYYSRLKDSVFTIRQHCDRFVNCKGCCFDRDKKECVFMETIPKHWNLALLENEMNKDKEQFKDSAKC